MLGGEILNMHLKQNLHNYLKVFFNLLQINNLKNYFCTFKFEEYLILTK